MKAKLKEFIEGMARALYAAGGMFAYTFSMGIMFVVLARLGAHFDTWIVHTAISAPGLGIYWYRLKEWDKVNT